VIERLARYIAGAPKKGLPAPVLEKTKHHVLDTIAAMVSGSRLLPGRKAIAYAKTLGGVKEATVIGSRTVTSAQNAALANGMLGHADETDDSHAPSLSHPGCAVVPADCTAAEKGATACEHWRLWLRPTFAPAVSTRRRANGPRPGTEHNSWDGWIS